MSLADAAANGHLQTHKTGADEIRSLRDLIERCLMRPLDGPGGRNGLNGQRESTKSTASRKSIDTTYLEIAANGTLALIAVACSLLDRQIASLEKAFVEEGGFTERLYRVRSNARRR